MSLLADVHEQHDATFQSRGGRRVVETYGKSARAHHAVRNAVGVIEYGSGVLVVSGDSALEFLDGLVTSRLPRRDEQGTYGLVLDPQGHVRTDIHVYNAGERCLLITPPGQAVSLAREWQERTAEFSVEVDVASDEFATFGVHGRRATEKIASVFSEGAPKDRHTFARGSMGQSGVTVARREAPIGERGFDVICTVDEARDVFDSLVNRGINAAPFGYRTWHSLTLEAGTPLFETELSGRLPNDLGLRDTLDLEKENFVGQNVVARIESRGRPSQRLIGLTLPSVAESGAPIMSGPSVVGQITRSSESPTRETAAALALVDYGETGEFTVRIDGVEREATRVDLPFVRGSEQSARLPNY